MAGNDFEEVREALARALADRKISDGGLESAARQIAAAKHPIRGIDVCTQGICIDFFIDGGEGWKDLPDLVGLKGGKLRGVEIFPWGILNPDMLQVRVFQDFDSIAQIGE